MRVVAFVDGFNLYHAIKNLGQPHLKWLDLWGLCSEYCPPPALSLRGVYYFSAFATWRRGAYHRHRQYVKALEATGVVPVMGSFKEKDRECFGCGDKWTAHEEKQTDVNIALHLVTKATDDEFDRAILVSADSDLVPAIEMMRVRAPRKSIRIVIPVGGYPCAELARAAGGTRACVPMGRVLIERHLLPASVNDPHGQCVAVRPSRYDPPPTA